MPNRELPEDLRRRDFLNPQRQTPFWQSPEFQRFGLFAMIALVVAGLYLFSHQAQQVAAPPPTAPPPPATTTLTPEEQSAREAYLATAFEGALRDQDDGADLQDTTGSRKLLDQIARYDADDFRARTQRTLDYPAAKADPEAWRGEFVRLYGVLGTIWAEKLARPVAGRSTVWRGQLLTGDNFTEPNLVEFIDRPMPGTDLDDLRMRAAQVEGIFYRTARFESEYRNGKGERVEATWTMPWVFVRNLQLIDEGQAPTSTVLNEHPVLILAILAFVIFGGRLLFSWFSSKRRVRRAPQPQTGIREIFERKLREKGVQPGSRVGAPPTASSQQPRARSSTSQNPASPPPASPPKP